MSLASVLERRFQKQVVEDSFFLVIHLKLLLRSCFFQKNLV